jgi:hypothetical protein
MLPLSTHLFSHTDTFKNSQESPNMTQQKSVGHFRVISSQAEESYKAR